MSFLVQRKADGKVFAVFDVPTDSQFTIFEEETQTWTTAAATEFIPLGGQTNLSTPAPRITANPNVIAAPLAEWAAGDPPTSSPLDIGLSAVQYNDNSIKLSSTSPVPVYLNGQLKEGGWVGIGIAVPEGTNLANTKYFIGNDPSLLQLRPLNQAAADFEQDGVSYVDFYEDIYAKNPKVFVGISWDGVTTHTKVYRLDFTGLRTTPVETTTDPEG